MEAVSGASSALILLLTTMAALSVPVFGFQFQVGGHWGWTKPALNESDTYNEWAKWNRFHVGDSLQFKYQNDSVLVVDRMSYESCLMSNPAFEFNDGDTVFRLDRHGFFYFISGNPGHCRAGQKLVVRVMVQSRVHPSHGPDATPHPAEGGNSGCSGGWDSIWSPPLSAANRLSVASPTMIALGGVSIILYLFM